MVKSGEEGLDVLCCEKCLLPPNLKASCIFSDIPGLILMVMPSVTSLLSMATLFSTKSTIE